MNELKINWNDVIKKEARGLDNADLGLCVTTKGLVDNIHSIFLKFW
jgi:hypothetical protein